MVEKWGRLGVVAGLLAVSACANYDIAGTSAMKAEGGAFNAALQKEYVKLAQAEADEKDWSDAGFFNGKALMAVKGESVSAQNPSERDLPSDMVKDINKKHSEVVVAVITNKSSNPTMSAFTQAMYDCWIQEQEENFQPEHIERCRANMEIGLAALKPKPAPAPEPMAKELPPVPTPMMVFFGFDSFDLSPAAMDTIKKAASLAKEAEVTGIVLHGHADKSGNVDYNKGLSRARVGVVGNAIMEAGIARNMVSKNAYGEDQPRIQTEDGVKERNNRRVEIEFVRE